MSKLETNQVDPSTGTTLTLGTSGDTIAIPSGVTIANSGTATGFGGTNTPSFLANRTGSTQSISNNTNVTAIFNNEVIDTDNGYDTSTGIYTIPSGKGGKYFIGINLMFADAQGNAFDWIGNLVINSSNNYVIRYQSTSQATTFTQVTNSWSLILDLSAGDALKVQGYVDTTNSSAGELIHQNFKTSFMGYKIIE